MGFRSFLVILPALLNLAAADAAGYVLPSTGTASTTQFYLGPELSSGTACGVDALPNGKSTSGKQGGGPGYLYVGIPFFFFFFFLLKLIHILRLPSINSHLVQTLLYLVLEGREELVVFATGSHQYPLLAQLFLQML
jgi:hypothetical protein